MLAKNLNDNACFLNKRGAWGFFASKLAPTKAPCFCIHGMNDHRGRPGPALFSIYNQKIEVAHA
ncbi:hypothetical protein TX23_02220 [Pseudomonas paralactis]|uniref:Uncharacterized protein n=1 Tax=Pseudomonas paralactis TaxID=1615673 RepID=A0A0R3APH3_9PSED|nr:hypothetical protein TX23_02220 [Pseudomonas paralactis]